MKQDIGVIPRTFCLGCGMAFLPLVYTPRFSMESCPRCGSQCLSKSKPVACKRERGATEPEDRPTGASLMDRLKNPRPLSDRPIMADADFFAAENAELKAKGE